MGRPGSALRTHPVPRPPARELQPRRLAERRRTRGSPHPCRRPSPDLAPRDYEQIALQLTGHARAVAADVRRHAAALPKSDGRGALAEVVLREADGRLAAPLEGTARCVQNRARLVRALYTRLDRLTEPAPAAT